MIYLSRTPKIHLYVNVEKLKKTKHYFLSFRLYQNQRADLNNIISNYTRVSLQIILYGSNMLPSNANNAIFDAIHAYIKETKDFKAALKMLFSVIPHQPLPGLLMAFIYHF